MRARVMVVDDHHYLDDQVKNGLLSHADHWDVEIVASEREALNILSLRPCDVLIAGMNGIDAAGTGTMARLSQESPASIRIGLAEPDQIQPQSPLAVAHRIVPNPCTSDRLSAAISGAITLKTRLADSGLANFIAGADILPLPGVEDLAILDELAESDPSPDRLATMLQHVPDTARALIRLAVLLDGAFGTDLPGAVAILGSDIVRAVVIFEFVHRQFPLDRLRRTGLANLKSHGYEMAHVARRIAVNIPGASARMAFIGGLLHDLGALFLAVNRVNDYRRLLKTALREDRPIHEVERKLLGVGHGDVGVYLAGLWTIPDAQAELLAAHARPVGPGGTSTAHALRLANLVLGDPGEPRGAIETRYGRTVTEFDIYGLDAKQVRELAGIRLCD